MSNTVGILTFIAQSETHVNVIDSVTDVDGLKNNTIADEKTTCGKPVR